MYCLWIDLEICGDCEFEASTCASLALSWWGGAWLEMAWSLCFLAEKLVNIWWTLRLKRVPLHWWNPAFTPTFKIHVLGANRSWRFWCFIRGMCRTQSCLAEARVSSCGNYISQVGLYRTSNLVFSCLLFWISSAPLGLRMFRNTPTTLNQAQYRSMTTEAPWALHPQKFLQVTVTVHCRSRFGLRQVSYGLSCAACFNALWGWSSDTLLFATTSWPTHEPHEQTSKSQCWRGQ